MVVGVINTDGTMTQEDISDYVAANMKMPSAVRRAWVTFSCSVHSTRCVSG
ncbi:hypothetical protein ACNKHM_04745 [Shigella sonnei]